MALMSLSVRGVSRSGTVMETDRTNGTAMERADAAPADGAEPLSRFRSVEISASTFSQVKPDSAVSESISVSRRACSWQT